MNLLVIGDRSAALVPSLVGAVCAGIGGKIEDLNLFCLRRTKEDSPLDGLMEDLNRCREAFQASAEAPVFQTRYTWASAALVFPTAQDLFASETDQRLLSALRGRGMPLSFHTDRDAVCWACSAMLDHPEDSPALQQLNKWLDSIRAQSKDPHRLTLLFDPSDAFEAGVALAMIRSLRSRWGEKALFLSLLALHQPKEGHDREAAADLRSFLTVLRDRRLLRRLTGEETDGADALWLLAFPTSFASGPDALPLLELSAARVLQILSRPDRLPDCGLHIRSLPGALSWKALDEDAVSVLAFLRTLVWFAADILPASRAWIISDRGAKRDPVSKNPMTRPLQKKDDAFPEFFQEAAPLERVLRFLYAQLISLMRSIPASLLPSGENESEWNAAVAACGRAVTTASEFDVSRKEAEETGLDRVMPVHRVSLADTEEERMLRRLDEMEEKLSGELSRRDEAFRAIGGGRSMQVLADCRQRCLVALDAAQQQLDRLMKAPEAEHLAVVAAERRVRLLNAAISRCDRDLANYEREGRASEAPSAKPDVPPASRLIDAEVLNSLEHLLSGQDSMSEKELRDHLSGIFPAIPLPEEKITVRQVTKHPDWAALRSLPAVFTLMFRLFAEEFAPIRLPAGSPLPAIPLLPDCYPEKPVVTLNDLIPLLPAPDGESTEAADRGLLAFLLLQQYRRFSAEEGKVKVETLSGGQSPLLSAWRKDQQADQVCLISLRQADDAVPFALVLPGKRFLPARWTRAHGMLIPAHIPWFDRTTDRFLDPVAFLSETDRALLLGQLEKVTEPINPDAADGQDGLKRFLSDFAASLKGTGSEGEAETTEMSDVPADPELPVLLKSVCGLLHLPAYRSVLKRRELRYDPTMPEDRLCACLANRPISPAALPAGTKDAYYYWKEIPFAREDARRILSALETPEKEYIQKILTEECDTLTDVSDDYRDALVRNLLLLRETVPNAQPEALRVLNRLLNQTGKPLDNKATKLHWPWDPLSPSVRTVMEECLGSALAEAALRPFSDLLVRFPARGGEIIGDALMSRMCRVSVTAAPQDAPPAEEGDAAPAPQEGLSADGAPGSKAESASASEEPTEKGSDQENSSEAEIPDAPMVPAEDALLPPLHPAFAAALYLKPEGRTLIQEGLWQFRRQENGVRAVLTLEGAFRLQLIRTYGEEEIRSFYAHDIPTLAVWPNLPFRPEDWHAYFVCFSNPTESLTVSLLREDGSEVSPDRASNGRSVTRLDTCPVCVLFRREGKTAGALFNLLPRPDLASGGEMTVCADIGSSAVSLVLSGPGGAGPLRGSSQVRILLNNPARSSEILRGEFLPAAPVSSLFPAAVRLLRAASDRDPVPFQDGVILPASTFREALSFPSDALYTCMKWDDLKGRAMKLCLHQILLEAALQARISGAEQLSWRFAVPDEMAPEGREYFTSLLRETAETVCRESGFPLPAGRPVVSFGSESQALGAYFRLCEPEETRGGLMVLDLGSSTADLSLTLRGRSQADWAIQLPMGIHYLLLPPLLSDPDLLTAEFSYVQDPYFLTQLSAFRQLLTAARTDSAALRKARLALDAFLGEFGPLLSSVTGSALLSGYTGRLAALSLFHCACLMMLSGLMLLQISADPLQNDFLPDQMGLFLSGRGSLLIQSLPDPIRQGLWRIANMFRNPRVSNLLLLFSSEKKLEIPVGLSALQNTQASIPRPPTVPSALPVRLEELLPEFLLCFRGVFPQAADLLFPGFFTPDFYHPFSAYGEAIVSASIQQVSRQALSADTAPRPYTALSAWPGMLLDLIRESRG